MLKPLPVNHGGCQQPAPVQAVVCLGSLAGTEKGFKASGLDKFLPLGGFFFTLFAMLGDHLQVIPPKSHICWSE